MAIGARRLPSLRKLAGVGVFVTALTNLRGAFELHRFLARRHFVATGTVYGTVSPQQRKLGL